MTTITADFVDAIKVQFLKPLFDEDFVERGMKAWLTKVEWDPYGVCWNLYFDFTDFEAENDKYLTQSYHPNTHTAAFSTTRKAFTAKEAGYYSNKLKCQLWAEDAEGDADKLAFARAVKEYLRVVE